MIRNLLTRSPLKIRLHCYWNFSFEWYWLWRVERGQDDFTGFRWALRLGLVTISWWKPRYFWAWHRRIDEGRAGGWRSENEQG